MTVKKISLGRLSVNSYMISSDKAAIVIDPGADSTVLEDFLLNAADKEKLILITHCHFDHIAGAQSLRQKTGVKIAISSAENPLLSDTYVNLSDEFSAGVAPFSADMLLEDMQRFSVGDIDFTAYLTPGHTPAGMCFFACGCLFSGDTLFKGTVGRVDLPRASAELLYDSLRKINRIFDENTIVYPGHGEATDIKTERIFNPYMSSACGGKYEAL